MTCLCTWLQDSLCAKEHARSQQGPLPYRLQQLRRPLLLPSHSAQAGRRQRSHHLKLHNQQFRPSSRSSRAAGVALTMLPHQLWQMVRPQDPTPPRSSSSSSTMSTSWLGTPRASPSAWLTMQGCQVLPVHSSSPTRPVKQKHAPVKPRWPAVRPAWRQAPQLLLGQAQGPPACVARPCARRS